MQEKAYHLPAGARLPKGDTGTEGTRTPPGCVFTYNRGDDSDIVTEYTTSGDSSSQPPLDIGLNNNKQGTGFGMRMNNNFFGRQRLEGGGRYRTHFHPAASALKDAR